MAKSKTATKSDLRRNVNDLDITQNDVRKAFNDFNKADTAKDKAASNLLRTSLMFATSHLSVMLSWDAAWSAIKATGNGKDKDAQEKKASAVALISEFFGIAPTNKDTSDEQATTNRRQYAAAIKVVELCVGIHRHKYSDAFHFPVESKDTYVNAGSSLYKALWLEHKYDDVAKLKGKDYATLHPYMRINDRKDQRADGETFWDAIRTVVLKDVGTGRSVTGSAPTVARKTVSVANIAGALGDIARTAEQYKDAFATQRAKVNLLNDMQTTLKAAFKGPEWAEGWESITKGLNAWHKMLGTQPTLKTTEETKRDIVTPDNVVSLPKREIAAPGQEAKSVPHPSNPANDAPAPTLKQKPRTGRRAK